MKENLNLIHSPPVKRQRPAVRSPRLKDTEFTVVSARVPRDQVEWLEEQAAAGFRTRADMIAFIIDMAFRSFREQTS